MTNIGHRVPVAALAATLLLSVPSAQAGGLKCKGDLVFADSLARAVTLFVDPEQGLVTTQSCFKYPELAGLCAGAIRGARNHRFAFGAAVSPEDSKLRIELYRTNNAVSTDTVLMEKPRATFLGRCEPTRRPSAHRRPA